MVVGSEATHPCSSAGVATRGLHLLSYTASISSSRLWSPPEVFVPVDNTQACRYQVGRSAPLSSTATLWNDVAQGFVCGALALH